MSTNSHLRLFTSESVTEGHPDKICDQISDAILDGIIAQDPVANVAVETMVTTGQVHVAGEVTTSSYVEIPAIVRETILGIGYDSSTRGFDGEFCGVSVSIGEENRYEELAEASVVSSTYDVADQSVARVGVVGPTRMDYPGTMSAVYAISRYLSDILSNR
mgnify:CR=1 FL=1